MQLIIEAQTALSCSALLFLRIHESCSGIHHNVHYRLVAMVVNFLLIGNRKNHVFSRRNRQAGLNFVSVPSDKNGAGENRPLSSFFLL